MLSNKVLVVEAKRTPIGSFMGSLSKIPTTLIGAKSIEASIKSISLKPNFIDEVYFGNVLQAGVGQAPARQSAIFAGISKNVPCTTINKVCSSGMKSIAIAAQSIALGENNIVVAGGMENMSLSPHYLNLREGKKFGEARLNDIMKIDGLMDPFHNKLMGMYAEATAKKYGISREEQDNYCIQSYQKSQNAWEKGFFDKEVCEIKINNSREEEIILKRDEECFKVDFDKIKYLKPSFSRSGTVTAANSSTINDGSASLISKRSICDKSKLALLNAIGNTLDGAVVNHLGSLAASAYETISAIGFKLSSFALVSDIKINAAEPSFIVEELAAVTVPLLENFRNKSRYCKY